jgi:hypothetical protein
MSPIKGSGKKLVNIIDSKAAEKPIYKWEGKPEHFRTRRDGDAWWDRERGRWLKGHGGLTGAHYFTVTQGTYKNSLNQYIRPDVRDGDMLVFEEYDACKTSQEDLFIAKRRGFALSSIFGGAMPMYHSITNPGATNLITSADKTRLEELYKEKPLVFYSELDPSIKPSLISSRQSGYLHFGKKESDGTITGLNSKIMMIQTSETAKDATAFEAYRATSIFIDEVFLHSRPDTVVASSQDSIKSGFRKINPIVLGGSCGVASSEGANKMQQYWLDSHNNMVRTVFIPGWMCITEAPELDDEGNQTGRILNFCPNGRSKQKESTEWILRMRSRLEKAKNKAKLLQFIKAYPLSIEEVFDVNTQGVFTEDVMERLTVASIRITKENYPIGRYDLYETPSGLVTAKVNSTSGMFHILEHPLKDVPYGAGNDPIPFGHNEDITYRRSENSIAIGSFTDMKLVAYHTERTHDADLAAQNMILLSRYYNNAKIMVERNRGGMLIDKIKTQGYTHLLANQPRWLGAYAFDKRARYGWYKDGVSSQAAYAELITFITRHSDSIYVKRLVDELKKFIVENTDLADAWVSFLIYAREYHERISKSIETNVRAVETSVVTIRNGQRLVERKTVYIQGENNNQSNRPDTFNHGR